MVNAPIYFARFIRKWLIALIPLVALLAVILAISQKKFSKGNFEFGSLTEVKGIYSDKPVPSIRITYGKDIWGNENIITVPLIGYGKHGADGTISDIENSANISLDGKEVIFKGTLLYNDGKLLLQIDANDKPLVSIQKAALSAIPSAPPKELGYLDIKGEIIDPKCYFGVMKPGEGKPHKDCAIRCISGGIPPVLKVMDAEGRENYYLLLGKNGEKLNSAIRDFVAEPVMIHARAVLFNDWVVLYVDGTSGIKRYSYLRENFGNSIALCSESCEK
jgi:hypothetical protein